MEQRVQEGPAQPQGVHVVELRDGVHRRAGVFDEGGGAPRSIHHKGPPISLEVTGGTPQPPQEPQHPNHKFGLPEPCAHGFLVQKWSLNILTK